MKVPSPRFLEIAGAIVALAAGVLLSMNAGIARADHKDDEPHDKVIVGTVFNDLNGNGQRDPGEPGLANVNVRIFTTAQPIFRRSTTTDHDGRYDFGGLLSASYWVAADAPAAFLFTTVSERRVSVPDGAPGSGLSDLDFGLRSASAPPAPAPVPAPLPPPAPIVEVPAPEPPAPAPIVVAEPLADSDFEFAIEGGRFYKQANGSGGRGDAGFAVVDGGTDARGNTINMYTAYQEVGGPAILGYAISRRYKHGANEPYVYQMFQNGALQWDPAFPRGRPANLGDMMRDAGFEGALVGQGLPTYETDGTTGDYSRARAVRQAWLDMPGFEALRLFYYTATPNAEEVLGLPAARPVVQGNDRVARLQRGGIVQRGGGPPGFFALGDAAKAIGFVAGPVIQPHAPGAIDQLAAPVTEQRSPGAATPTHPVGTTSFEYKGSIIGVEANCGVTELRGMIRNRNGDGVIGKRVRVAWPSGSTISECAGCEGRSDGNWDVVLDDHAKDGHWIVYMVERDSEQQISDTMDVRTTGNCEPGGVNTIWMDFRQR